MTKENDLPNVDAGDTAVEGTSAGKGQPTVSAEDQKAFDEANVAPAGLVNVRYTGSENTTVNGVSWSVGDVKTMNNSDADGFLSDGKNFELV
jgi:hypothetical protein